MAFILAESPKISINFNIENLEAGNNWLRGFFVRNTELSVRKAEGVSVKLVTPKAELISINVFSAVVGRMKSGLNLK